MPEINFNIGLIIGGIIIFLVLYKIFVVPRLSLIVGKHTESYKKAMRFIRENKELRKYLGEIFEVKSIPNDEGNIMIIVYKFEIIGEKGTGILSIKMASKLEWYIYIVILEYKGGRFIIFR